MQYPVALDVGIRPDDFWSHTLMEIIDLVSSHNRTQIQEKKEKINLMFVLAQVTAQYSGLTDATPKQPWDYFPELFEEEQKIAEERMREQELETFKENRRRFVAEFNRRRNS